MNPDEQEKEAQTNRFLRLFQRYRRANRFKRRVRRDSPSAFSRFILTLPLITAIIGAIPVIWQYASAISRESKKSFLERQIKLYEEATQVSVTLATSDSETKRQEAYKRFWELYWGELPLVEDAEAEGAMSLFGDCLRNEVCKDGWGREDSQIKYLSLALAYAFRQSLGDTYGQKKMSEKLNGAKEDAKKAASEELKLIEQLVLKKKKEAEEKEAKEADARIELQRAEEAVRSASKVSDRKQATMKLKKAERKRIDLQKHAEDARKVAEEAVRRRDAANQRLNNPRVNKSKTGNDYE